MSGVAHRNRKPMAFSYYGGKFSHLNFILTQLETPHHMFVELCCGSAVVTINKPKAVIEVINDLSQEVTDFWKALRDHPSKLKHVIDHTPAGESEFKRCIDAPPTDDIVERARRFFVRVSGAYGAKPACANHSFVGNGSLIRNRNTLPAIIDRMRDVFVENTDAVRMIERAVNLEKRPERLRPILFYADPPYHNNSRVTNGGDYIHDDFNHDEFLAAVVSQPPHVKFAISGYPSPLYDDMLSNWHREESVVSAKSSNAEGSSHRTEVLWRNYAITATERLL